MRRRWQIGDKFGAFTIVGKLPAIVRGIRRGKPKMMAVWACLCACGEERSYETCRLSERQSCGCVPRALPNLGDSRAPVVRTLGGSLALRSEWESILAAEGMPAEKGLGKRIVLTAPNVLDDRHNRYQEP